MKKNILILTLASLVVGTQVQATHTQSSVSRWAVPAVVITGGAAYMLYSWFNKTADALKVEADELEEEIVSADGAENEVPMSSERMQAMVATSRAAAGIMGAVSSDAMNAELQREMTAKRLAREQKAASDAAEAELAQARAFASKFVNKDNAGDARKPTIAPKPNLSVQDRVAQFERKKK